jgi:hypothetical protein
MMQRGIIVPLDSASEFKFAQANSDTIKSGLAQQLPIGVKAAGVSQKYRIFKAVIKVASKEQWVLFI